MIRHRFDEPTLADPLIRQVMQSDGRALPTLLAAVALAAAQPRLVPGTEPDRRNLN